MIIGVPKEIKSEEYRVALLPSGARAMKTRGHRVIVEKGAGLGSGFNDSDYARSGAALTSSRRDLFHSSEMILKVKEPLPKEYDLFREGQIVFTFFHFAASRRLTTAMIRKGIVGIPYETIQLEDGSLPILTPMSEIAGKLAVQAGARYLERPFGGSGVLLGRVAGVPPPPVAILAACLSNRFSASFSCSVWWQICVGATVPPGDGARGAVLS
jgi:alanine dehydrogenase